MDGALALEALRARAFGRFGTRTRAVESCLLDRFLPVHLRPPSIDRGVTSALWAIGLALFIFLGSISVGLAAAPAFIVAVVAGGAIFLYVRLYGEDPL